jgi:hypothetical protein
MLLRWTNLKSFRARSGVPLSGPHPRHWPSCWQVPFLKPGTRSADTYEVLSMLCPQNGTEMLP